MQPFKAAMLKVRQAFYDAFTRSLLRTKSLLQTILDLWISPRNTTPKPPRPTKEPESEASSSSSSPEDSEEERLGNGAALGPSDRREKRTVEDFIDEVSNLFRSPTTTVNLTTLSSALHSQFVASLKDNAQCMLPSFQHQMPSGKETGTFLALDVGGSTFRVALIQLFGKDGETRVLRRTSTKIDGAVRGLMGVLFFDWMAERIEETLEGQREGHDINAKPLSMGMAWSFPIEQTSPRSGLLMDMGKHFMAAHGLQGQDLGDLIQDACGRRNLNVSLRAIVNDSSACLLSSAFTHPDHAHPFSLILGTGVNAAVNLPTSLFSPIKFGKRPDEWHASAKNVLVNSEFSMFGATCLPFTRFDRRLLENHPRPDFQPIEHFVAGGYMGEIVRLVLVECIETTGIFGGSIPPTLTQLYSLDTETLSKIEADPSPSLSMALELFAAQHPPMAPYTYTLSDIQLIRTISSLVVQRASAIVAAGLHALNTLQSPSPSSIPSQSSQKAQIAYNGSVIEHYPHFRENTQQYLDSLISGQVLLELVPADDSSLIGAAVAVACLGVGEMDL